MCASPRHSERDKVRGDAEASLNRTVRPCLCAGTGLGEGGGVGSWLVVDEGGNGGGGGGGDGDGGEGSNSGTGDSNQRHWTNTGDARVQSWSTLVEEATKETLLAPRRAGFGTGTSDERFGSTRGSEDREEKEAVREAFELSEAFELAVSEDFLCGTDGVNCSLRCESVGEDAPEPDDREIVSVHKANLGGRGGGDVQD